ncbi:predicted branched-chain amino acid permease [Longilinea arvoryzae]|uniref:Predicted branched-chain amino acid permease n=1 Tax=Longilinea arvoryzae TaxID=360412 RepID=A0A0S7BKF5_9CHLR|nr:AzlC family ABC transporter permease [Longilinea arvoryzae]GAP15584.1 predicted branched-chain amino acid permease [Longilinea arvoryzae]
METEERINPSNRPFSTGIRDCLPVVLGYLAIGLAFGVVGRTAGLSVLEVFLLSTFLYAGSAQFIFASMAAAASPLVVIVLTIFLVNIRHSLYSAALAPHLGRQSLWKNILIGAETTDETFALTTSLLAKGRTADPAWLFGINLTAQFSWVAATTLGALLGQTVSNVGSLGLDYALTAMFAALMVLQIANHPRLRTAVVVAALAALVAVGGSLLIPAGWAMLIAALMAASAGLALEGKSA